MIQTNQHKRFLLTNDEIKRLNKLSYELGASNYETFHLVFRDALENWTNGLKTCRQESSNV